MALDRKFSFGGLFAFISTNVAVISLLIMTISYGASSFVFLQWGLNFSMAAAPSDLITVVIDLALVGLVLFAGVGPGGAFGFFLSKIKRFRFLILFSLLILILFLPWFVFLLRPGSSEFLFYNLQPQLWLALYVATGFVLGALATIQKPSSEKWYRKVFLPLGLGVLLLEGLSFASTFRYENLIVDSQSSRCQDNEYVLWAGSERLVTSCDKPPYDTTKEYFIVPREGLTIHKPSRMGVK